MGNLDTIYQRQGVCTKARSAPCTKALILEVDFGFLETLRNQNQSLCNPKEICKERCCDAE